MAKKKNSRKPIKKAAATVAKKTSIKAANKIKNKIVGDLYSRSPEAKAIYKNRWYYKHHTNNLKKQMEYDKKHDEKKRLAFIEYYNKKYPPPK